MAPGLPKIPTGEKSGAASSLIGDEKWTFFISDSCSFQSKKDQITVFLRGETLSSLTKERKVRHHVFIHFLALKYTYTTCVC